MTPHLTPALVLGILFLYFAMLVGVAWLTGRNVGNDGFFLANRKVPWYIVAYGMIGTSISGVTFISLPGAVGLSEGVNRGFGYFQMVLGYLVGYFFIATVLMPLYYRLKLTSIYGYLEQRFGPVSYKTGAAYFMLSRTLGSAARMFLSAAVLFAFVFKPLGVPFWLTVILMLALIYAYTFRGGLKTIIWTDVIMTTFFLVAVVWTVVAISQALDIGIGELWGNIASSKYGQVFYFDNFLGDPNHFVKQFVSGAFIAFVMTGLDQDLMQKNLACINIKAAQKNMLVFCIYLVLVNIAFLTLGALLYIYADNVGLALPERTDHLYPQIAFFHLDTIAGIFFILGLVASTYSSADSALTALTTSFCVDFLGFEKEKPGTDPMQDEAAALREQEQIDSSQKKKRMYVHLGFSFAYVLIILLLNAFNNNAVISLIFQLAGYTYGPLLGLYLFGLFTKLKVRDKWVLPISILAPVLTYVFAQNPWFDVGFLTILINGLFTFLGLWAISDGPAEATPNPHE
jgi:Na+/proline symporter